MSNGKASRPGWRRRVRSRTWLCLLAVLAGLLWAGMRSSTALIVTRDVGAPDAIVMLASHESERLPAAAALARRYPAAVVILTLPEEVTRFNCERCPERVAWLGTEGVAASRVTVLPLHEKGTYGEAVAVRRHLERHPVKRLTVVTSPYHTRRALATFETHLRGTGVTVGIVPASPWSPARPAGWPWHEYDREYVAYEWAAVAFYWLRHGVRPW